MASMLMYCFLSRTKSQDSAKFSLTELHPCVAMVREGQSVGPYTVSRVAGRSAFGDTGVVRDSSGVEFFYKRVNYQQVFEQSKNDVVVRNIHLGELLNHPHICKTYELLVEDDHIDKISMYYRNGDLEKYLKTNGGILTENDARRVFWQLCSAVGYLHKHWLTHNNLHSGNVLFDHKNDVIITDVGLVRRKPQPNMVPPPEGLEIDGQNKEVDMWALGVLLYQMVAGKTPKISNRSGTRSSACFDRQELPAGASDDVVDLLEGLLTSNVRERLLLEEVIAHKWFRKDDVPKGLSMDGRPIEAPTDFEWTVIHEAARVMAVDADSIAISLLEEVWGPTPASYFLLATGSLKEEVERRGSLIRASNIESGMAKALSRPADSEGDTSLDRSPKGFIRRASESGITAIKNMALQPAHNNAPAESFDIGHQTQQAMKHMRNSYEKNKKQFVKMQRLFVIKKWFVATAVGVAVGVVATLLVVTIYWLLQLKFRICQALMNDDNFWGAYATFVAFGVGLAMMSAMLVVYIQPLAAGSGIAEVKAYLNGNMQSPGVLSWSTLFCRYFGLMLSVSSGLFVGKEGPIVHISSIVASKVGQSLWAIRGKSEWLVKNVRRDQSHLELMSIGTASGIAAAFDAPIGGILFALEEAASFWSQEMTFQCFFAAMLSTFTIRAFYVDILGLGPTTFVEFLSDGTTYEVWEIFFFAVVGAIGGLGGSIFNWVNMALMRFRRKYLHRWRPNQMLEVLVFVFVTVNVIFLLPLAFACKEIPNTEHSPNYASSLVRFNCAKGEYNEMGTLFFGQHESIISLLFIRGLDEAIHFSAVFTFGVVAFIFSISTHGIAVPAGLFVPNLLIGSAMGRLMGQLVDILVPSVTVNPGLYSLVGAGAMCAGFSHLNVSMIVIMVEVTNDVQFLLPIMVGVVLSRVIAGTMDRSIYNSHMALKNLLYLASDPPIGSQDLRAEDIMRSEVRTLKMREKVRNCVKVLRETEHNGFPVINGGRTGYCKFFSGIILRRTLHLMLEKKRFEAFESSFKGMRNPLQTHPKRPLEEVMDELTEAELDMYMILPDCMDPSPLAVYPGTPLPRVYRLFRSMGLRHLCVVDYDYELIGIITRKDLTLNLEALLKNKSGPSTSHKPYFMSTNPHVRGHTMPKKRLTIESMRAGEAAAGSSRVDEVDDENQM